MHWIARGTALAVMLAPYAVTGIAPSSAVDAMDEEVYPRPADGVYRIVGHGWGHGRGMSQWGAQGAATLGLSYQDILAKYYPGATLTPGVDALRLRVRVSDHGATLRVSATSGLRVTTGGKSTTLARTASEGKAVRAWRVRVADGTSSEYSLDYTVGTGWRPATVGGHRLLSGPVGFAATAGAVRMTVSGGQRSYRGELAAVPSAEGMLVVNTVDIDDYLRSVVAAEMNSSWRFEALKAQAVAARTYALWHLIRTVRAFPNRPYDICDITACQVYRGARSFSVFGVPLHSNESERVDAAVRETAGEVLTYHDAPIFSEFSASNGGHSTAGDVPYLRAEPDPWDGVVTNSAHTWSGKLTAAQLERAWPRIGKLRRVQVLARDGNGEWGGRISLLRLEGTQSAVTVTGAQFQQRVGLRGRWWRVVG